MLAYFKGKSVISKLIRWRTWGEYSHVAWIVDQPFQYVDLHGTTKTVAAGTIYESWQRKTKGAARNGVRKGTAGDLHKRGTPVDLYAIEMDDHQYAAFLIHLEAWVANPKAKYDWRGVLSGFTLRKKNAHSKTRQFCSEFLMRAFFGTPFRFLININPEQTSPADMSRSPAQRFVGTWATGKPLDPIQVPKGWR